jgi:hypothetical protein
LAIELGLALLATIGLLIAFIRIKRSVRSVAARLAAPQPQSSNPAGENQTRPSDLPAPLPAIDTWDVFDTLIARYCIEPHTVFEIVAQKVGLAEFPDLRVRAQRELDNVGKPYVIFDIYEKIREYGIAPQVAERLLAEELAVESDQSIPIRRNIERVGAHDLLVSDMYLTTEMVSSLVAQGAGPRIMRPPIVGNWGKATGAVWPMLAKHYQLVCHHGDNPHSDHAMPTKHGVSCELVEDHRPTEWEQTLMGAGEFQLALLLRECRLRTVPVNRHRVHEVVCGPFLSILVIYALQIYRAHSGAPAIVFCSRDCDQLAQVFRTLCPTIPILALDLNRYLLYPGMHDAVFNEKIPDGSVIVDFVGTGRSILGYIKRNPAKKLTFQTLLFADHFLLEPEEIAEREQDIAAGVFRVGHRITECPEFVGGYLWHLEILLQPGYDMVTDLVIEPGSGAMIRSHEVEPWAQEELEFLEFKNSAVHALIRGLKTRPTESLLTGENQKQIQYAALVQILADREISDWSSTFFSRDTFHAKRLAARGPQFAAKSTDE